MRTVSLLLPVLVLSGCEELEPFMPTVSFQEFRVNDIDFEQIDVDFAFDVENPNPVDVQLASFSYGLGLGGVELLHADDDDGFALEAVGSSELALPVQMRWEDAWSAVQATRGEDDIGFDLDGHFGFDTPIGEAKIPYRESGTFPALRTPSVRVSSLRVGKIDLWSTRADVQLVLDIDNDHASTLFFDNFDYALSSGGHELADGVVHSLADVEGATQREVVVPMSIDLVSAGTVVVNALAGHGTLDIDLDATTDVETPFGILPLAVDESGNVEVQSLN